MINDISAFKKKLYGGSDVTIDFVGDSITWGLNHCAANETFVSRFAELLAKNFDFRVVRYDGTVESEALPLAGFEGPFFVGGEKEARQAAVIRNGVGGNTVRRALRRKQDFTGKMPNGKNADLIFLMFGINDALSSDKSKFVSPETFERDYEELLSVLNSEDALVIILSPTYNGTNYPLDAYATVSKKIAAAHGLPFIDTHALWINHYRKWRRRFGQGSWLSKSKTDACHFSPKGASKTASYIFEEFLKLTRE